MTLLIATHAFAASSAWLLGAWQLFVSTRGDARHRLVGRVWVGLALYVAVSSFWMQELRPGQFSLLHILSVVTIVSVTLGIFAARRGNIRAHQGDMIGPRVGMTFAESLRSRFRSETCRPSSSPSPLAQRWRQAQ